MASPADGSQSLSSDETPDNFCDPCKFRGIQTQCCHYCRSCAEYLCIGCKECHESFKATRNHTIVSSTDVAPDGHNTSQFKVYCACDQSLEVAIYCESHNEVACITCKSVKHRKCTVNKLQEKGLNYKVSTIQSTIQSVHSLEDKIKQFQQDRDADVQRIEAMIEKSREKTKSLRKDFDIFFDKLENNMLSEIEEKAKTMRFDAEQHIPTCTNTLKLLNDDLKMLDVASKSSNTVMAYAADVKISKRLTELQSMLKDFQDEAKPPRVLEFEENQKLMDLKEEVKTLGSLRVKE